MHHEINKIPRTKQFHPCMQPHSYISFSTNLRSEKVVGDNVRHLGRVGGGRVQVVLVGGGERVDGVSPDHCREGESAGSNQRHIK